MTACMNNRGGGVLVAIKTNLRSIRSNHLEGRNCEQVMFEIFPLSSPKLIIGVFYRTPNDNYRLTSRTELNP